MAGASSMRGLRRRRRSVSICSGGFMFFCISVGLNYAAALFSAPVNQQY